VHHVRLPCILQLICNLSHPSTPEKQTRPNPTPLLSPAQAEVSRLAVALEARAAQDREALSAQALRVARETARVEALQAGRPSVLYPDALDRMFHSTRPRFPGLRGRVDTLRKNS
jgi:hypothetical protein